jgi:thermostable 8-oxoguanine DNA glycosylase
MTKEGNRARLIRALRRLDPDKKRFLIEAKAEAEADGRRPDLLWRLLVGAMATLGNALSWERIFGPSGSYKEVSFAVLEGLSSTQRRKRLREVLRRAKVRWPRKKAVWLDRNFQRIQALGGLHRANQQALAAPGREAKMQFMRQFAGIGPKYARDVWMDIYDPSFRNTVALDVRVKKITTALGYSFQSYEEEERFFQEIAKKAGREPWEVDRLLYRFNDYFLGVINRRAAGSRPSGCN